MHFDKSSEFQFIFPLIQQGEERFFERGEWVYQRERKPAFLFFIEKGLVGLLKETSTGQESLLRVFKDGQFFGHRTLFSEETYHASSRCLEPSKIIRIPKKSVFEFFDKNPEAYVFLVRSLAKELRRAEDRSLLVSEAQILERVSSALLLFKKLYPDHLWTRSEIASYCATRTPTVIKALADLEKEGAIKQSRRYIEILDEGILMSHLEI